MAFLGNLIDPNAQPAQDYSPLPSGEYVAMIIDSDMKPTRNNTGQYLELTYQVVDGPMKNRLVWCRLNLDNPNQQAVSIAQSHLAAIRAATGVQELQDSQQLHNIPHLIRVEFVPAGPKNQRDGNEVRAWKRVEGAAPVAAQGSAPPFAGQQPASAPATAANQPPAWAKPAA